MVVKGEIQKVGSGAFASNDSLRFGEVREIWKMLNLRVHTHAMFIRFISITRKNKMRCGVVKEEHLSQLGAV